MSPSGNTARVLLSAAVVLGAVSALLQNYASYLGNLTENFIPYRVSNSYLLTTWASIAVTYLVTPVAFYLLGRRNLPGFRVSLGLVAVYVGAFLGEALGQTLFSLFYLSPFMIPIPFIYLTDIQLSLSFLFVAFSGLSVARLRRGWPSIGRIVPWFPLAALAFALPSNFLAGFLRLGMPGFDVVGFGLLFAVSSLLSLPMQFIVFYYIGRKVNVRGSAPSTFGWLFLGTYAGAVVGAAIAVGVFGQSQWAVPPGNSFSMQDGIIYSNLPTSLVTLLMSLNPLGSLPFLSFFAVTLPQVGKERTRTTESLSNPTNIAGSNPADYVDFPCSWCRTTTKGPTSSLT